MTNQEQIKEKLIAIQRDIIANNKEIILLSKYRKATSALLTSIESLFDEEHARLNALTTNAWQKS